MKLRMTVLTKYVSMAVLSVLSIGAVSIVYAQESGVELEQDRQEFRELKREHKRQERELRRTHKAKKMLLGVDKNKDGQVDLNEYLTHAQERFNKLDLDGNGFVTPSEAKDSMRQLREEHKERRKAMREKRVQER